MAMSFSDLHDLIEGLTDEDLAATHLPDLDVHEKYGVRYLCHWFDAASGKVFYLVDAPDAGTAETVHREAHGLVADHVTRVHDGV